MTGIATIPPPVVTAAISAFIASLVFTPIAIRLLTKAGVFDVPSARSSHLKPVVRGLGIAVIPVAIVASLTLATTSMPILISAGLACAVGAAEDLRGLHVKTRVVAQVIAAVPLCVLVVNARSEVSPAPWLVTLVVVVCIPFVMAVINSVNFMDGINGISVAFAVAAGGCYAWYLLASDGPLLAALPLCLAAALLGFAPFNVPKAQGFLGDSGSYGLGAGIAGIAILTWTISGAWLVALAPLTIYLTDTGIALLRKIHGHESLTAPHRLHVYQRLVDRGWSQAFVSLLVGSFVLASGAVAQWSEVAGQQLAGVAGVLGLAVAYEMLPVVVGRTSTKARR